MRAPGADQRGRPVRGRRTAGEERGTGVIPACIGIASRQRNRLDGFCELWGSKSQCDRAEPIRRRTLSQVDVLARHARIEDRDAFAELRRQVLRMNDAAWWIEHKNDAATMLAQDIEL